MKYVYLLLVSMFIGLFFIAGCVSNKDINNVVSNKDIIDINTDGKCPSDYAKVECAMAKEDISHEIAIPLLNNSSHTYSTNRYTYVISWFDARKWFDDVAVYNHCLSFYNEYASSNAPPSGVWRFFCAKVLK